MPRPPTPGVAGGLPYPMLAWAERRALKGRSGSRTSTYNYLPRSTHDLADTEEKPARAASPALQLCSTPSGTGTSPNQRAARWVICIGADGPPVWPRPVLVEVRIVHVQDLHLIESGVPGEG